METKTHHRVVRITASTEACTMTEVLDTAQFISKVLSEILIPIKAYTDNESPYRNTHYRTMAGKQRVRIELAIIKQMLEKNELHTFKWIPANQQLANC